MELEGVEAIVKTASKAKFFIEFHSSCLEGALSLTFSHLVHLKFYNKLCDLCDE